MIFHNRKHAGELLAKKLQKFKSDHTLVLALPRGGVPIAAEIARVIQAPLEVLLVRKVGAPFQSELAAGAICEEEEPIWNAKVLYQLSLEPDDLEGTVNRERENIHRQAKLFRESKALPAVSKKIVILVDDGLATGATMSAAVKFLRKKGAAKIVAAVPIAAESSVVKMRAKVDEVITLEERSDLISVGQWYQDFSQVEDAEVISLLKEFSHRKSTAQDYTEDLRSH